MPDDAVDPSQIRLWVLYDAAKKGGIMMGVWLGFLCKDGTYGCGQLLGKGLLANEQLSTPKLEHRSQPHHHGS